MTFKVIAIKKTHLNNQFITECQNDWRKTSFDLRKWNAYKDMTSTIIDIKNGKKNEYAIGSLAGSS